MLPEVNASHSSKLANYITFIKKCYRYNPTTRKTPDSPKNVFEKEN
tara:strand:+ start:1243 stop:1380 length:138 start_codon:yes stop_codon:yes gene_type:complete